MERMKYSTRLLYSNNSEVKEKLSALMDDSSYPFVILPSGFSSCFESSVRSDSLLEYCIQKNKLQSLREPRRPDEPRLSDVPKYHLEYVREGFWCSTNGHIVKVWLIVAFLFGGLPGYGLFPDSLIYERLLMGFFFVMLWTPVLIILLVRHGEKRDRVPEEIPYTKDEIEDLRKKEKNRYEQALEKYPEYIRQYEEELKQYNSQIIRRENLMRMCVPEFLSCKLKSSFSRSEDYSVTDTPPQKGRSEDILFSSLMNCIPSSVYVDTVISGYYPDIMVSTSSGVYIDVEIDEPYEMESKKEIHYIGCGDETRDLRITKCGWIVLRFSEKQIMTNCSACVKLIVNLLKVVESGNLKALDDAVSLRSSILENRWRKEDARMMAINNVRLNY